MLGPHYWFGHCHVVNPTIITPIDTRTFWGSICSMICLGWVSSQREWYNYKVPVIGTVVGYIPCSLIFLLVGYAHSPPALVLRIPDPPKIRGFRASQVVFGSNPILDPKIYQNIAAKPIIIFYVKIARPWGFHWGIPHGQTPQELLLHRPELQWRVPELAEGCWKGARESNVENDVEKPGKLCGFPANDLEIDEIVDVHGFSASTCMILYVSFLESNSAMVSMAISSFSPSFLAMASIAKQRSAGFFDFFYLPRQAGPPELCIRPGNCCFGGR